MRCTLVVKHLTIFHAFYCVWTNFFIWIQRWKKRQTLQTSLCYFSQLVLIFWPGAPKTMREECYTHCIISTRAISINNAFSCYLQIFHSLIGHLHCFVAIFLVLIFLGIFCICAILIAFSISAV